MLVPISEFGGKICNFVHSLGEIHAKNPNFYIWKRKKKKKKSQVVLFTCASGMLSLNSKYANLNFFIQTSVEHSLRFGPFSSCVLSYLKFLTDSHKPTFRFCSWLHLLIGQIFIEVSLKSRGNFNFFLVIFHFRYEIHMILHYQLKRRLLEYNITPRS